MTAPPLLVIVPLVLFVYPILVYPALLWVLSKMRPAKQLPRETGEWPELAYVICALNEQSVIEQKLRNTLALDYPAERLHIIVVNDGSADRTAEIVRGFASQGVELIDRPVRRGKVSNLNDVILSRTEPFVVLSDANVLYEEHALKRLMRHFADPGIGCVTGKVILIETIEDLLHGEQQYYSLEWWLQEQGSRIHSMVGADGAMYAIRRELFRPCPADTLIEDFIIPIQIVRQGYRVIMDPDAFAWEQGPASLEEEFRRKVRIAAGAAQAVIRGNGLPSWRTPLSFWFVYTGHKLLRWVMPLTGLAALGAALATLPSPWSAALLIGAGLILLLALIRWVTGAKMALLNAPFYFVFGQIAVLKGLWRGISGKQSVLWAKASR